MNADAPSIPTPQEAADALAVIQNTRSGLGVASRDRSEAASVTSLDLLDEASLTALWRKSALVRRICSKRAQVALAKGVELSVPKGDAAWLQGELTRLGVLEGALAARSWGKLYGGALLALTVEGQDPSVQLRPTDAVRRVARLTVFDRFEVIQTRYDDGAADPSRTGEPRAYLCRTPSGGTVTYDASRVWRFGGAPSPRRAMAENAGWEDSELQGPYPALARMWQGVQALGTQLHDSNVGVWTVPGLNAWIAGGNRAAIQTWLDTQLLYRGVLGDHAVDKDGAFDFKARPLQDAIEAVAVLLRDVATEVDMPHTELFGISPSGLNASEESDRRKWHESVETYERPVFTRFLGWLLPILQRQAACPRELRAQAVNISWPPLEVETRKEQDEAETAQVANEVALVGLGALRPEEVRARLARSPRYLLSGDSAQDADPHDSTQDADPQTGAPENFRAPESVAAQAARGIALRERHKRGGTLVGVARANQLVARENLSAETVVRMYAFFERFKGEVGKTNASGRKWGDVDNPTNAWIAWLLWGGDEGYRWARRIVRQYDLVGTSDE